MASGSHSLSRKVLKMEDKKLKQMISELANPELLFFEYGDSFFGKLDQLLSVDEAYKTGESPIQGEIQERLKSKRIENIDESIRISPYFEMAHLVAVVQLILNNNRRLLKVMAHLIGDKGKQ